MNSQNRTERPLVNNCYMLQHIRKPRAFKHFESYLTVHFLARRNILPCLNIAISS